AGQTRRAKAGPDGRWIVRLSPLKASAMPRTLVVAGKTPESRVEIAGVLVGEVWICSGQSNMQWTLGKSEGGTNAAMQAADPLLRLYRVPSVKTDVPLAAVTSRWTSCEFSNSVNFSGVAFFFGRDLRAARNVPVGLIQTAWGGTPAESWTPRPILEGHADLKVILDEHAKAVADYTPEKAAEILQKNLVNWSNQLATAKAEGRELPQKPRKMEPPAETPKRPCCLYNAMIAPLVPYAIRGAIWYQGESNSGRAKQYETLFPVMIGSWRQVWGQGDFPFLFVQIAPHQGMVPEIREAQLVSWQTTPNTAMAVITDVGEEKDIHPVKKVPVGARLALAARALAHGEKVVYSGPVFRAMSVQGNRAILEFAHTGSGLVAAEGGLKDFTVAPAGSTNFVPAQAVIESGRVVVTSPGVAAPGVVRYGWSNWFVGSLFNKEGLPATPFRTDRPR
ncbi:MAG: sialate O-acetylesterase, partial [Verrucomicrobia bacterium]|nr:sialate O-acetylesterase [Verrucomicrobiota bacterium]